MINSFILPDLSFTQGVQDAEELVVLFGIRRYAFENIIFHRVFPNKFDLKHYLPEPYNDIDKIESTIKRLVRKRQITKKLVIKEAGIAKLNKYDDFIAEKNAIPHNDGIHELKIKKPIVHRFEQMKQATLLLHFFSLIQSEKYNAKDSISHQKMCNLVKNEP